MVPDSVHLTLQADRPPWTPTGLQVCRGDRVTLLGSGFVRWCPPHDAGAGAKRHLWGRVPGGEIFGCTQDTTTTVIDHDGELELCVHLGAWADRKGALATGDAPYRRASGGLDVTVLRWVAGADPVAGLTSLGPGIVDPSLAAAEHARLCDPVVPPPGWEYLLEFGPGDVYRHARRDGRSAIDVVCDDNAGVIRTEVGLPLGADTTLEWTWRVDEPPLPAPGSEGWIRDQLSVAVEFDTGQELSWCWAAAPEPAHPGAPIPLRAGGPGATHHESRTIVGDYRRHLGRPPDRIVGIRLTAVSHLRHSLVRASFSGIVLRTGRHRIQVL
ncbi:hypothetical protein PA7_13650 [Pseudonocardia asaccharolytica DSM 44247 = NBRC 16224]|uniref:Uncharacterized protein n=2 Tax=Pseudonocardia asaccharolytica TaxID=54010 RepID=A0A511D3P1_9PSEU|nr:hypothetical protein PA7_13650 [Pseudonocardia asaccharolytica DSM 44247 = NBRC 16224]